MTMYRKIKNSITQQTREDMILRIADNAFIPFDNLNSDYLEYLEWVNQGNVPQEAEVI
jgi:hypothetical protein